MLRLKLWATSIAVAIGVAAPAIAAPCEGRVSGYKPGQTIAGLIRYAGDGDSLCIGPSSDPRTWIEIREARWFAPELHEPGGRRAKAVMDQLVGRRALCTGERGHNGSTRSYDRVVAACSVDGRPLGQIIAGAGIAPGGGRCVSCGGSKCRPAELDVAYSGSSPEFRRVNAALEVATRCYLACG